MGNRVTPEKGEMYEWQAVLYYIRRVDPDLRWADVTVHQGHAPAVQQQVRLPLPIGFKKVGQ